jgi:archaeosine-15-forming tRNA-guanine transglycosylase
MNRIDDLPIAPIGVCVAEDGLVEIRAGDEILVVLPSSEARAIGANLLTAAEMAEGAA